MMKYVSEDATNWCKHRGFGFSNGFEKCTSTTNTFVFDNLKEVVGVTEIKALDGQDYPSRLNLFSISDNTLIFNVADGGAVGINTTFSVTACGYK